MRTGVITLFAAAGAALSAAQAQSPAATQAPASSSPSPPTPVAPLVVTTPSQTTPPDATLLMPGDQDDYQQVVSIWPGEAYLARLDGRVRLRCEIDAHGLAERCEIASESPVGHGFGEAALSLRPTFKLPPAMGPDGPRASTKTIAIVFRAPLSRVDTGQQETGGGVPDYNSVRYSAIPQLLGKITLLNYPVWSQAPDFDDLAHVYPEKARGAEGYVVAHCRVLRTGDLRDCTVIKETPELHGFAKAALTLTEKFKVEPALAASRRGLPVWTDIPIRIPPPADIADRAVTTPLWLTRIDPKATPKVFPPEAVKAGVSAGRGIARCVVAANGTLTRCSPEAADPDGLGFSEAAVRLASSLRMNLWSADGVPVAGGVVRIPVRLNLKTGG